MKLLRTAPQRGTCTPGHVPQPLYWALMSGIREPISARLLPLRLLTSIEASTTPITRRQYSELSAVVNGLLVVHGDVMSNARNNFQSLGGALI
jgi:hypothetical protein